MEFDGLWIFGVGFRDWRCHPITGLIAAIAIMEYCIPFSSIFWQFTYTFPLLLRLDYDVITDAVGSDELYSAGKGTSCRIDTERLV